MNFNLENTTEEHLRQKIETFSNAMLNFATIIDDTDSVALTFSREDLIELGTMLKLYTHRTRYKHTKC